MDKVGLQNSSLEYWIWQFRAKVEELLGSLVQMSLSGSHTQGSETEGSDVDLFVVVPKLDKRTLDVLLDVAWEIGCEAGIIFSVVPGTVDELLAESPFSRTVQREGVQL